MPGTNDHPQPDRSHPGGNQPSPPSDVVPGDLIHVDAGGWGLTWLVRPDGQLAQTSLGPEGHLGTSEFPAELYPLAYRTWGAGDPFHESALRVTHSDGTLTTRLQARWVHRSEEDYGEHIVVGCTDGLFDLDVEHHLRTNPNSGMLEQWVEVTNHQSGAVVVHDYDSLCHFMVVSPDATIHHFGGSGWADEWHWTCEALTPGIRSLTSLGGIQPHLQRSPMMMISPDGPTGEHDGAVVGMSIAWGGNTRFHLDIRPRAGDDPTRQLVVKAGANPYGAEYRLAPGARLVTPTVAWTWAEGRCQMTDRFHRWTRTRVLRDPDRRRAIVANNWEATFFDFDEERIIDLMARSADVGAEVFLLDDGWFGSNYPRDDDTQGLGDWEVDVNKLPNGIGPLVDAAGAAGIRFGIWVEPEMVNPRSRLYQAHPDWVIRDRREPSEHRWQLALDPLVDDVRDFEVGVVESTLAGAPGISYVKWDANRPITDPGTNALPPDSRSNLFIDGVHATWDVMRRVADAHPEVDLMLCASGGGRSDHGTLRFFHEFWTSDNTDPLTRIEMQWAALHFFPAAAVAAHVTRWGERPLGFACAVALSARFGLDLDLASLGGDEIETLRTATAMARRTQDLVQKGRLTRGVSPFGDTPGVTAGTRAALTYTDDGTGESVLFRYRMRVDDDDADADERWPTVGLEWIDPQRNHVVWHTTFGDGAVAHPTEMLTGEELSSAIAERDLSEAMSADVFEIRAV